MQVGAARTMTPDARGLLAGLVVGPSADRLETAVTGLLDHHGAVQYHKVRIIEVLGQMCPTGS
jgi:hypothetical protein